MRKSNMTRPGASTTRSSPRFARTATTWKTFYLLSLMLFTFDFPRDRSARAELVRADGRLVARDDHRDYQESRGRVGSKDGLIHRTIPNDENSSAEPVGKWRNNGEALEPKWRDGDTVPLLPFSQFSRYSDDRIDGSEEEGDYTNREIYYRQKNGRENSLRSRSNDRISYRDYEDYGSIGDRREYEEHEVLPRRRNEPSPTTQNAANPQKTSQTNEEASQRFVIDKEATSKYRETFQGRPNDYEHDLSDDEYLKPRPRKRKPPQNYEFDLAENETLNERKAENSSAPWLRPNVQKSPPESEAKGTPFLQNAMELKSLLKMQQEEGLSLSEILQRRNLTLNDLLKGKADVINALKSKNLDETDDYTEDASKRTSNTFVKVSIASKPQWTAATVPTKTKNPPQEDEHIISIIPLAASSPVLHKNLAKPRFPASNRSRAEAYAEVKNPTTGKSILIAVDPPRTNVTPAVTVPTVITTSVPLVVATNSMEFLRGNDGAVKLQNSDEIKSEGLDEDEIMEFSDFTDYKKGRNGVSPVWLMMKDEEGKSSAERLKDNYEDKGSTLSIEQILGPTERSKPTQNLSSVSENSKQLDPTGIKTGKTFINKDQRVIGKPEPEGDYNKFSGFEYQDDTPFNTSTDESSASKDIMREIESTLAAMPYDKNFKTESHQLTKNMSVENNVNHSLKNHQDTNVTERNNYDDTVSEVEPEARAEIIELFASGSAGKRLERLLKSRNMSLEELIALRQRGSSKVHLAEVSRLRAQKPKSEHRVENKSNIETTTLMPLEENLYEFKQTIVAEEDPAILNDTRNQEKININNYLSRSFENIMNNYSIFNLMNFSQPEKEGDTERPIPNINSRGENEGADLDIHFDGNNEKQDIKESHRTVQIVDLLTTFGSLPFAKDIQRDFAGDYDDADKRKLYVQSGNSSVAFINNDGETLRTNGTSNVIESGSVKEIIKQQPNSINIQTVYSETSNALDDDETGSEKRKTLSKVRPSIIASGAILGVTVIIFLAIFIVCRIRQKQKYRYRNSFSRAVFQGPVMAARKLSNSSSLSTVMVNVVATSTTKRPDRNENQEPVNTDIKCDIDNDSLDANDSWETIPDYMK